MRGVQLRAVQEEQRLAFVHFLAGLVDEQLFDEAADLERHVVELLFVIHDAADGRDRGLDLALLDPRRLHTDLLAPDVIDHDDTALDLSLGDRRQVHRADRARPRLPLLHRRVHRARVVLDLVGISAAGSAVRCVIVSGHRGGRQRAGVSLRRRRLPRRHVATGEPRDERPKQDNDEDDSEHDHHSGDDTSVVALHHGCAPSADICRCVR